MNFERDFAQNSMGGSGNSFSLSSLMCEEVEATFFEDEENTCIDSIENPCFVLEDDDDEEYIEYLFRQETGFGIGSQIHFLSCDDDHSERCWLMSARLDAIDWIFNVSFSSPT